jgi:arginyl-tRNA synthetase
MEGCLGVSNKVIYEIVKNIKKLEDFNFSCQSLTNQSFKKIAKKLTKLKRLKINFDDYGQNKSSITEDKGIKYIVKYLNNLEELILEDGDFVTDKNIINLTNIKKLKKLNISSCYKITNLGIQKLQKKRKKLTITF